MDISFYTNEGRFNFRVAAYVTCGDKMLIEHTDGVDFVNLIGGRIHLGENTIDAVRREMKEEIGVEIKKQKLMVIAENFFEWQGKKVHEMLYIYQVELEKNIYNKWIGKKFSTMTINMLNGLKNQKLKTMFADRTLFTNCQSLKITIL